MSTFNGVNRTDESFAERTGGGIRDATVLNTQDTDLSNSVSLKDRRSGIEEADAAQVILDMKLQEAAYQAARP